MFTVRKVRLTFSQLTALSANEFENLSVIYTNMKDKIRFYLVGFILMVLWVASFITQNIWSTGLVAIIIGIVVLKFRSKIIAIAVQDDDYLAKNVPVIVKFQRKSFELCLPMLGAGFLLFGIYTVISSLTGFDPFPIVF